MSAPTLPARALSDAYLEIQRLDDRRDDDEFFATYAAALEPWLQERDAALRESIAQSIEKRLTDPCPTALQATAYRTAARIARGVEGIITEREAVAAQADDDDYLAEFRLLGSEIHRFRCTNPDCRHYEDETYFTPRDNDAASAVYRSRWLTQQRASAQAVVERVLGVSYVASWADLARALIASDWLAQRVRDAEAQAWDKGLLYAEPDGLGDHDANPYRAALGDAQGETAASP